MIKEFTRFWKLDFLIKHCRGKAWYTSSTYVMVLLLGAMLIVSCEDDGGTIPYSAGLYIKGPQTTTPETKVSYSAYVIDAEEGSITWTVQSGPATLTSTTGNTVEVNFSANGPVVITASNGSLDAWYAIDVTTIDVIMTTEFAISGIVNNGGKDTIFFNFEAPLASAPSLYLNGTNASDTSGFFRDGDNPKDPFNSPGEALSAAVSYKGSTKNFFAIYTGGTGNGQPEVRVDNLVVKSNYGGATKTNQYVLLPSVDNVAPVGQVTINPWVANNGTTVTITATFNEGVRPTRATVADTLIFIDIAGGGVTSVRDTLFATSDPAVWSMTYTTDGNGDGTMTATVVASSVVDLGGNSATTISVGSLTIDNTAPTAVGSIATDLGKMAIQITASSEVSWVVKAAGSVAPTSLAELTGGKGNKAIVVSAAGNYDVYFMAVDAAGNESAITPQLGLVVTN